MIASKANHVRRSRASSTRRSSTRVPTFSASKISSDLPAQHRKGGAKVGLAPVVGSIQYSELATFFLVLDADGAGTFPVCPFAFPHHPENPSIGSPGPVSTPVGGWHMVPRRTPAGCEDGRITHRGYSMTAQPSIVQAPYRPSDATRTRGRATRRGHGVVRPPAGTDLRQARPRCPACPASAVR